MAAEETLNFGDDVNRCFRELAYLKRALDRTAIVATTDRAGKILACNEKFVQISGYTRDELIGANHRLLNSGHHPREFFASMYHSISNGEIWRGEIRNRRKDGSYYWVDTTIVPTFGANDEVVGYTAIRFDVTARKTIETELIRARDAAREAESARNQFLAVVTHELNTPLNGVFGFSELLLETRLDAEQREYADSIRLSANQLLNLVNDILDFTAVISGMLTVSVERLDVRRLASEVATHFESQAAAKGVDIVVEVPPGRSPIGLADPRRLQRAIDVLVDNAIKFTESGRITLHVATVGRYVEIAISDTGIGIPRDRLESIFKPFSLVDATSRRRHCGMGLGLAIAKALIELMGGSIHCTSELGKGSCFTLRIPLGAVDGERQPSGPPPSREEHASDDHDSMASAPRVLLADDDEIHQRLAQQILESVGIRVTCVADGREAFDAATRGDFAAILMDCRMPEVDGLAATALIRRHESETDGRHRIIIAMTASTAEIDRKACFAAGVDDFIAKPFSRADLLDSVRRWIRLPEIAWV